MAKLLNVGPSRSEYCVDPNGRIRHYRCRPNVTHRALARMPDGSWGLSAWGAKNGWAMLESLYRADPDEDVRERGWQVWLDFNEHAAKTPMKGGDPFPEEWLPQAVKDRREGGGSAKTRSGFVAPEKKQRKPSRSKTA